MHYFYVQLLFCKLGGVQLLLGVLNSSENPGVQLRVVESLALLTTNGILDLSMILPVASNFCIGR